MAKCSVDVEVGDTITYRMITGGQIQRMVVQSIQTGTAQGCLYVGTASVWDWQVTEVNGERVK